MKKTKKEQRPQSLTDRLLDNPMQEEQDFKDLVNAAYPSKEQSPQSVGQCPVCGSENIRKDYDFPDEMMCCNSCLSDFTIDGEVTLNAKTFQKEQVGHTPGDDREPFIFELSISKLGNKPEITLWEFGGNDGDCGYDFCTVTSDEPVKHSQLIIDAVNNTAGKNINPEAVPDMLEALKEIIKWVDKYGFWITDRVIYNEADKDIDNAKTALNKATKQ